MRIVLWPLSVALAFLAGWGFGRGGDGPSAAQATVTTREVPAKSVPERKASSSAWGQRLRDQPSGEVEVWTKVPAEERGAAIEAWLASYGLGGPAGSELSKVHAALDQWAAEDFDGAWAWANGLHDPSVRELAMTGLAGSIASSDPDKAFECFISHGEFHRSIEDFRITGLIERMSAKAAAESPEALRQLWARIPPASDSVTTTWGVTLKLPDNPDFAAYLDALRDIRTGDRSPVNLTGVMERWAKQDTGAATDYLLSRGESVPIHGEWNDIHWTIKTADGKPAADRWMIETLREVPEDQRSVFFKNINFVRSTDPILALDPELFEPGERNGYAANLLEAQIEGDMDCRELLGKVPAAEWIPALENVRGLRSSAAVEEYLRSGGVAEDEVKRLSELVCQPKEAVSER